MGAVGADPVPARRCTPAPAATSRRTSAPTSGASKAPDHIGILVALKDRQNALKNPYAHLHEPDITFDSVKDSLMLWDPIRYRETCPSSDGACAMVLAERGRRRARAAQARPGSTAPRCARADDVRRARPGEPAGRPGLRGRRLQAGRHHQPARGDRLRRDVRAVLLVRADVAGEPRLRARGRRLEADVEDGVTALDGDLPVNCRAACCRRTRSAPPACSASPRPPCRSAARPASTRSTAPARALGHAYGGGSQFFAMWVVGSEPL